MLMLGKVMLYLWVFFLWNLNYFQNLLVLLSFDLTFFFYIQNICIGEICLTIHVRNIIYCFLKQKKKKIVKSIKENCVYYLVSHCQTLQFSSLLLFFIRCLKVFKLIFKTAMYIKNKNLLLLGGWISKTNLKIIFNSAVFYK